MMMHSEHGYDEEEPGEEEIMIVPLVDIVFLLLIFFIVTSSFRKPIREWDVQLPESTYAAKGAYRADELIIVFMANKDPKTGKVEVWKNLVSAKDGGVRERVTETELRKVFFAAQSRTPIPVVRLEIDRSVPHYHVAETIDSLHSFNLRNIAFRARDR